MAVQILHNGEISQDMRLLQVLPATQISSLQNRIAPEVIPCEKKIVRGLITGVF